MKKNGLFITVEGIDGCGKSTLISLLKEKTTQNNIPCVFTKEPGGSTIGKQLRGLLQQQTSPLDAKAEFLLFAADRAQHMHEVIMPGLARGALVISDRCADSSLAYQGYGLGLDVTMIEQVNRWAMNNIQPDAILYLHLSPEVAMNRIQTTRAHLTTFEMRPLHFWQNVYAGYEKIFKDRKNIVRLDASQAPELVADTAWKALQKLLHMN